MAHISLWISNKYFCCVRAAQIDGGTPTGSNAQRRHFQCSTTRNPWTSTMTCGCTSWQQARPGPWRKSRSRWSTSPGCQITGRTPTHPSIPCGRVTCWRPSRRPIRRSLLIASIGASLAYLTSGTRCSTPGSSPNHPLRRRLSLSLSLPYEPW